MAKPSETIIYIADHSPTQVERLKQRLAEMKAAGQEPTAIVHVGDIADSELALKLTRSFYEAKNAKREPEASFVHSGHWLSNQPPEVMNAIRKEVHSALDGLFEVLAPYLKKNKVHFVIGNVDSRYRTDFYSQQQLREMRARGEFVGDPEKAVVPLPRGASAIDIPGKVTAVTDKYSSELPHVFETRNTLHVLYGFDALASIAPPSEQFSYMQGDKARALKALIGVRKKVHAARKAGKTIVLVPHGTPNWQVHGYDSAKFSSPFALLGRDKPTGLPLEVPSGAPGENKFVTLGLAKVLNELKPDEVIHGHNTLPLKFQTEVPGHSTNVTRYRPGFVPHIEGREFIPVGEPHSRHYVEVRGGGKTGIEVIPLKSAKELSHRRSVFPVSFLPDGVFLKAIYSRPEKPAAKRSVRQARHRELMY